MRWNIFKKKEKVQSFVSTEVEIVPIKKRNKNIKSTDPEVYGHSIKNIHIKHMLMHQTYMSVAGPKAYQVQDLIKYVCISCVHPTPEKSTWKLEEVTCKNCLRELKTILHKVDYRSKRKAIYNSELHDEVEECSLPPFCVICMETSYSLCSWANGLGQENMGCPYEELLTKMKNGMHDCPKCGGEKEYLKSLPTFDFDNFINGYISLWKCKLCGHVW
jgi:hypothetical protein